MDTEALLATETPADYAIHALFTDFIRLAESRMSLLLSLPAVFIFILIFFFWFL